MGRHRLFWRLYATYLLVIVAVRGGDRRLRGVAGARPLPAGERGRPAGPGAPRRRRDRGHARGHRRPRPAVAHRRARLGGCAGRRRPRRPRSAPRPHADHGRRARTARSWPTPTWTTRRAREPRLAARGEARRSRATTGLSIRYSETLDEDLLYVAMPLRSAPTAASKPSCAPRCRWPRSTTPLADLYRNIALIAALVALAAALVGLVVSRRISGQMRRARDGRRALRRRRPRPAPRGPADRRVRRCWRAVSTRWRTSSTTTIGAITDQRNERDAMLSSMVEGVFAVDTDERIITVNSGRGGTPGDRAGDVHGRAAARSGRSAGPAGVRGRDAGQRRTGRGRHRRARERARGDDALPSGERIADCAVPTTAPSAP